MTSPEFPDTVAREEDVPAFEPLPAAGAPPPGGECPLDALLNHLQGNALRMHADPGLARFGRHRLNALAQLAQSQSQACLDGLRSLTRLMGVALESQRGQVPRDELAVVANHLHRLVQGYERWRELAENADFYRDNREVAVQVQRRWLRAARNLGEWPEDAPR